MERNNTLQVQFMTTFELSYGGHALSVMQDSASKSASLLAILLLHVDEGVSRDKLIAWLYPDGDADASNSLKALLFRLRKHLRASGLPECEYVTVRDGVYCFTKEIPVASDVGTIHALHERARHAEDADARAALCEEMVDLYRGEMLPLLSTELWVVIENAALTDEIIDAAKTLSAYYQQRRDYERAYAMHKRMSEFMPFDEQWHVGRINSLISLGRYQQAMDEYESVTGMLFDELGVFPSERLMDCARTISSNIMLPVAAASDVNDSLSEPHSSGAYYCSYPSFVDSYRVLRRIMERTGMEATLVLCTVADGEERALTDRDLLVPAIQRLTVALGRTLRKSDMFTRYSTSQMLVMLWDCPQENASISIERINRAFYESAGENKRAVHVTYAVLSGSQPPLSVEMKKPARKWKRMQ